MERTEMKENAVLFDQALVNRNDCPRRIEVPRAVNFIVFQFCWFACVLGAVNALPSLGPIAALGAAGLAVLSARKRSREIAFLALATFSGTMLDLIPLHLGAFSFVSATTVPWAYPLWMSGLWLAFATTFRSSLSWLSGRYLLASVFGFIGGPLSYYAGEKLGAISIGSNTLVSLLIIGIFWAIITPGLFHLSERIR